MNLNITLDIQDIFDITNEDSYKAGADGEYGGSNAVLPLNEIIKSEIIEGVKRKISDSCMKQITERAQSAINKSIQASIDNAQETIEKKAIEFADDWLEKEVTIRDKWGDDQECLTITDLIKRQFDDVMNKKVDSNGKFSSGYGNSIPLHEYLIGSRIQKVVEEKMKGINKGIDTAIAEAVNTGIRKNVSDKFAEMVVSTAKHNNSQIENKG